MELKKLQKIESYQKKLKKLLNNKGLSDIILFGSFVKGNSPNDVDVGLVLKEEIDLTDIKKSIKQIFPIKVDFQRISLDSLYLPIWITLIKEGFSIKENKYLHEIYKVKPVVLFKYSLNKLTNIQKVQFARGMKATMKDQGSILTRSVVLVPLSFKNEFVDFLKTWNLYYESQEFELLPILKKEEFY